MSGMPEFPQALPKPPLSLDALAAAVPGAKVHGNGSIQVVDLAHPRMVTAEDQMVLILEPEALELIKQAPFPVKTAVVAEGIPVPAGMLEGYVTVARPRFALAFLLGIFQKPVHAYQGVHPAAVIEASADVHPGASIGAFVYIGENAVIGEGSILMPHVTVCAEVRMGQNCLMYSGVRLGERVMVGNRVTIHHNASIGADGFSYVTPEPGSIESARTSGGKVTAQNSQIFKINSIGTVVIEDDVEIGACTTIDRSNLGATLIKRGTKVDNLVMIGHNNVIGENCMIVSQVGISGSCEIGNRVVIAGQAGLADHLKIGDDAIIMAKSGVMRDIESKEVVVGIPALPRRETLQNVMYTGKLREMFQELKALRKKVEDMEARQRETVEV
ncbi:MAG TPA: UDP-3-O-(3-hydroxymyristoyl)glucosamine N-acyltransferase [Coleofasciculaceae cyanobacterium]|jgi:UDP-3-O-[3-hydroxymyristoyl] glucosamine N-acyltransferase